MPNPDPVLAALRDTQQRLSTAYAETEQERLRRHRAEQRLDQAHRMLSRQVELIENLGGRPAREVRDTLAQSIQA